jgi:hypothetical protein
MSEERDTTKEYDQQHGTPKGTEPTEINTTSTSMVDHSRPLPFTPKSSGSVE